ncbi:MAG: hypothetical protein V8S21_04410 [Lachnospira eligens]
MEFFNALSSDEWYMFTFNFEGIAGEAGLYRDDGGTSGTGQVLIYIIVLIDTRFIIYKPILKK